MSDTDLIPVTNDDHGPGQKVIYTNWRGETAERTITPITTWFGSTEWHPEPQFFVQAWDHEKRAVRDFALSGFGYPAPEKPITSKEILERAGMDGPFEVGPFPPEERQKPTLPEKPDSDLYEAVGALVLKDYRQLLSDYDVSPEAYGSDPEFQQAAYALADAAIAVVVERCAQTAEASDECRHAGDE